MFKTAQNRDKRMFLTTTIKPFKNTTITAYYEKINVDGRRRNPLRPTLGPRSADHRCRFAS